MEQMTEMRKNFEKAVTAYVAAFLKAWELNPADCWWVGDRVGCDLYCFGDLYAISLSDMIYVVENGVTYDEFLQLTDYLEKCDEYNLPKMNLQSWHKGAPRHDFTRLDALKKQLEDAVEEAKKPF